MLVQLQGQGFIETDTWTHSSRGWGGGGGGGVARGGGGGGGLGRKYIRPQRVF